MMDSEDINVGNCPKCACTDPNCDACSGPIETPEFLSNNLDSKLIAETISASVPASTTHTTGSISDIEFRELLDCYMWTDGLHAPWKAIEGLLDREANARGFDGRVDAYHKFTP